MISIAMAAYNGERYIAEQIESILTQTISDFELIVVDDCSKDKTYDICQNYASKDNRIKVFRNENNMGYVKNFEKALSLTKGEYVAMSDQDDVWTPNHLEVLLNNLGGKALSCGNVTITDANLFPTGHKLGDMYQVAKMPADDIDKLMSIIYITGRYQGASMLFRKELKEEILPFPEGIAYHDFWISCLACLFGGINYTDKCIASYRIHGNNVSGDHKIQMCRIRSFARLCLIGMRKDRIYYIRGLKRFRGGQFKILNEMERFYERQSQPLYFFHNVFYLLRHAKSIFCL